MQDSAQIHVVTISARKDKRRSRGDDVIIGDEGRWNSSDETHGVLRMRAARRHGNRTWLPPPGRSRAQQQHSRCQTSRHPLRLALAKTCALSGPRVRDIPVLQNESSNESSPHCLYTHSSAARPSLQCTPADNGWSGFHYR